MAKHFRYLQGEFESQFSTVSRHQASPSVNEYWSLIRPEQRFILSRFKEIGQDEFDERVWQHHGSHILIDTPAEIELRHSDHHAERTTFETLLIQGDDDFFEFVANKDQGYHGRLTGTGYCKIFTHETPDPEPEPVPVPLVPDKPHSGHAILDIDGVTVGKGPGPSVSVTPGGRGCLGSLLPSGGGASGAGIGGGAGLPNAGCARWGCGLIGLLFLLGLLGGLLRNCSQPVSTVPPQIIHDTVYVEVSRVDTVEILRIDTLKLIDSVRQVSYETVTLPNVNFFTGSAKLTPSSITDIQQVAEYLNSHPQVTAVVIGHTDSTGNHAKNMELSRQRAESVRNMIVTLGVDETRVTAVGKGDTEPRGDNRTEEGRLMNRRVEVRLSDPLKSKVDKKGAPEKP